MKAGQFNGINYIQLEGGENLDQVPFVFGNYEYLPGEKIDQLGKKKRTMLKFDVPMIYKGTFDNYVCFTLQSSYGTQLNVFDKSEQTFIAPVIVNSKVLLMQSTHCGFWDIRA